MTLKPPNGDTEDNYMTDFQFRALMTMVLEIIERSDNLEDAKRAVKKFASGDLTSEGK